MPSSKKSNRGPLEQRDMSSDFEVHTFQTLQRSPEKDISLILKPQEARQHPDRDKVTK